MVLAEMGLGLNGIGLNGYWPNWELDQVALDKMALDKMGLDEVAIPLLTECPPFWSKFPVAVRAIPVTSKMMSAPSHSIGQHTVQRACCHCCPADGDSNDFSLSFSLAPALLPHTPPPPRRNVVRNFRAGRFILLMVLLSQSWLVRKAQPTFMGTGGVNIGAFGRATLHGGGGGRGSSILIT